MTIAEEQKVLAAAAAGDAKAMEALFGAYEGLLAKAARLGKVRTVAEDALAVARMEFFRAVRRYDPSVGVNFAAFAKSMVHAGVHQFFRREARHWKHEFMPAEETSEDAFASVADAGDPMGAWEGEEDMRQAFSLLSECERKAMELVFLKGLTQRKAAQLMAVRPQTLNDAKERALRKLRAYFMEETDGGRCFA